jgi:hypothetical protein
MSVFTASKKGKQASSVHHSEYIRITSEPLQQAVDLFRLRIRIKIRGHNPAYTGHCLTFNGE